MLQNRILISHDTSSMPLHFERFLAAGNHSPGLLLVPQDAPVSQVIESVVLIWMASEAEEWANLIRWLPL